MSGGGGLCPRTQAKVDIISQRGQSLSMCSYKNTFLRLLSNQQA